MLKNLRCAAADSHREGWQRKARRPWVEAQNFAPLPMAEDLQRTARPRVPFRSRGHDQKTEITAQT